MRGRREVARAPALAGDAGAGAGGCVAQPADHQQQRPPASAMRQARARSAHGYSPTRITSASRSAARSRARRRLSSVRSVIGPMRTRCQTSSSTATRCTLASMPCNLSCAQMRSASSCLRYEPGLQHVDAGPFDLRRRGVALARDLAILLRHHDFEVRQHVVEVVILGAVLDVAGAGILVRARIRVAALPPRRARHSSRGSSARPARTATVTGRPPVRSRIRASGPGENDMPPERVRLKSRLVILAARMCAPYIALGRGDAENAEAVADHLLHGQYQRESRITQRGIFDDPFLRVVIGVQRIRKVAQVVHQRMRRAIERGALHDLWIFRERGDHRLLMRIAEQRQARAAAARVVAVANARPAPS